MRILIADDDLSSRRMIELLLDKLGHEVTTCVNGEAALTSLFEPTHEPFDIALLDWEMPKLTGPEVCATARRLDPHLPTHFILLTAKSGSADIVRGLDAGADDYIAKPFNVNELDARLRVGRRIVGLRKELRQVLLENLGEAPVISVTPTPSLRRVG